MYARTGTPGSLSGNRNRVISGLLTAATVLSTVALVLAVAVARGRGLPGLRTMGECLRVPHTLRSEPQRRPVALRDGVAE